MQVDQWQCEVCGRKIDGKGRPIKLPVIHACKPGAQQHQVPIVDEPPPPLHPCEHRGEVLEIVGCQGCWSRGLRIAVEVHACDLYGRCHQGPRNQAAESLVGRPCWICVAAGDNLSAT